MLRPAARRGEAGIVGVNLVLFLSFALFAVVQLTRTTLAAQSIDTRVTSIVDQVKPINANLNSVPKLDMTNATAAKIKTAADPLSGDATAIIDTAKSIDGTVDQINGNATAINSTVHGIAGNVGAIHSSVQGIGASIGGLVPVTDHIRGEVVKINHHADAVIALANQVRSDLSNVLSQVGGTGALSSGGLLTIDGHANSIDCHLLGATCQR